MTANEQTYLVQRHYKILYDIAANAWNISLDKEQKYFIPKQLYIITLDYSHSSMEAFVDFIGYLLIDNWDQAVKNNGRSVSFWEKYDKLFIDTLGEKKIIEKEKYRHIKKQISKTRKKRNASIHHVCYSNLDNAVGNIGKIREENDMKRVTQEDAKKAFELATKLITEFRNDVFLFSKNSSPKMPEEIWQRQCIDLVFFEIDKIINPPPSIQDAEKENREIHFMNFLRKLDSSNTFYQTIETTYHEQDLYTCASTVERDQALNQEMQIWDATTKDGLNDEEHF